MSLPSTIIWGTGKCKSRQLLLECNFIPSYYFCHPLHFSGHFLFIRLWYDLLTNILELFRLDCQLNFSWIYCISLSLLYEIFLSRMNFFFELTKNILELKSAAVLQPQNLRVTIEVLKGREAELTIALSLDLAILNSDCNLVVTSATVELSTGVLRQSSRSFLPSPRHSFLQTSFISHNEITQKKINK